MPYLLLFCVITTIIVTILVENDEGTWATITVALGLLLYWLLIDRGVFGTIWTNIQENPWLILAGVFLWILTGVFWSFYKWYLYLINLKEKGRLSGMGSELMVSSNKGRIIMWMTYWPISVLWFAIHNPITRIYNWIYQRCSGTYRRIYLRVFNEKLKQ